MAFSLYYIATMDYILTDGRDKGRQFFQLPYCGRHYKLVIHHLTLAERRQGRTGAGMPREHSHNVYHIVLFLSGANSFSLKGARARSHCGTMVLTSPGDPHDFTPLDEGESCYAEFTFSMESEAGALTLPMDRMLSLGVGVNLEPFKSLNEVSERDVRRFSDAFARLLQGLREEDRNSGVFSVAEGVFRIFRLLVETVDASTQTGSSPGLRKSKMELDRNFRRRHTLGELARTASLSPAHFCRSFKAAYGMAPVEYLFRVRHEAAKSLLLSTSLSCKEIALMTGFSDPVFFNKMFKKAVGCTPGRYREEFK
jgi:AraC-like DNA-binding protein